MEFKMLYGLDYYIIAIANSQFAGKLRLDSWIEKHQVPEGFFEPEPEEQENEAE